MILSGSVIVMVVDDNGVNIMVHLLKIESNIYDQNTLTAFELHKLKV